MSSSWRYNKRIWLDSGRIGANRWVTALLQPRKGVHCFGKQSAHKRKCQVRLRVDPYVNWTGYAHRWNAQVESWEGQEADARRYDWNHLGYQGCGGEATHTQTTHRCSGNALIPHSKLAERFGVCCRKTARMGRRFWYGKCGGKSFYICSKTDA